MISDRIAMRTSPRITKLNSSDPGAAFVKAIFAMVIKSRIARFLSEKCLNE